ncbi:ribonuclease III domain-containing protein, partial [Tricladium varicosporioides]
EELIGYEFNNKKLCWEALQGKGANGYTQGNKRLALVGDAIIRLKVLEGWYPTNTPTMRGNDMVEARVKNRRLGTLGSEKSLEKFIVPNPSQRGHVEESLVADTMEALIGAVHADG